jgi:hypothetical protein
MDQEESSPTAGTSSGPAPTTFHTEDEYEQLKRFQIELEFVQCLSNPWYLHRTFSLSVSYASVCSIGFPDTRDPSTVELTRTG